MRTQLYLLNSARIVPIHRAYLDDQTVVVGRSVECDVVIPHRTVSRVHARLIAAGEDVRVCDMGSQNGTFVNGERITEGMIRIGEQLRFGSVEYQLLEESRCEEEADEDIKTDDIESDEIGSKYLPPAIAERLSPGQIRVLDLVLEGMSEKRAAFRLGLSQHTVHNHLREIYLRLDVHSRAELMALLIGGRGT